MELDALCRHPLSGLKTRFYQQFAQFRIGPILGEFVHIVEELCLGVGAEVDIFEFGVSDLCHLTKVLDATISEAERTTGKERIAGALFDRRGLDDQNPCAFIMRRDC